MAAVHNAGNGVDGHGVDGNAAHRTAGENEYDRHSMLGNLVDDNEEDVPLLYFHSIPEAFRWFTSWMIPGMGMFCEAYFIFSIGNIKPFFTYQYPRCYNTTPGRHPDCSSNLTRGPDYSQILGIVCGMIVLGFIGDKIGRKWGSVTTVALMIVGAIFLTANGASLSGHDFTVMYIVSQFLFGFGVGGEYPMAAGSAAERAEAGGKKKALKRGQEVVLTFSMQGVGNFVNTAVLLICFPIYSTIAPTRTRTGSTTTVSYSFDRLNGVWRTSFGVGLIPLLFMLYYRVFRLRESAVWRASTKNRVRSRGTEFLALSFHFWHRLLATAGTWFLWDFSFYGNKVFQSSFIRILSPGASLFTTLLWTLLNSGCALVGYYIAAFTVDCRYLGRLRIQLFGFLMVAVLFYVAAIWYHPLITPGGIHVFQFIYFFSSFWGQFGPNCTTFLLAGELYPTAVRTSAHGFSAGVAKLGALWAAIWFNYLDNRHKFWLTASFNIGGFLLTLLFMPDPLRVSLAEVDRRWAYITSGRTYHGPAIAPGNLSLFERFIGVGKNYDRAKDEEDRWQESMDLAGGAAGPKPGYEAGKGGVATV